MTTYHWINFKLDLRLRLTKKVLNTPWYCSVNSVLVGIGRYSISFHVILICQDNDLLSVSVYFILFQCCLCLMYLSCTLRRTQFILLTRIPVEN